jgi:PAS domain S-box-containing protein
VSNEHGEVMRELSEQFKPVMEQSPDGVYLWLDETHKACNERLAKLFGYTVEEWCAAQPFLDNFVAEEDRGMFSWNYHKRVAALTFPVTFRFRGLRKDGSTFSAETDMIPVSHRGHAVAYHFGQPGEAGAQTGDREMLRARRRHRRVEVPPCRCSCRRVSRARR